jgi:hypothetical protein
VKKELETEISFLPESMIPKDPKFIVWWTGTLGQAEWLITHSQALRGMSVTRECGKKLDELPKELRPLAALEQPDLIITTIDMKPLMSIEITEQQEFGTNAQQRMARFWSAAVCGVPSAYLLPIESYQLEKASAADSRILEVKDSKKREFLGEAATFPEIRGESLWNKGINDIEKLHSLINDTANQISGQRISNLTFFYRKHFLNKDDVLHISKVDGNEYVHQVGSTKHKAYIRPPKVPSSMVLNWFALVSKYVPSYPFKLHSEYKSLFRTNGIVHTVFDDQNPHLSFRNLPPGPGKSPIIHKSQGKDEITLFFEMVDYAVSGTKIPELGRSEFTAPDKYYPSSIKDEWRTEKKDYREFLNSSSGDSITSSKLVKDALRELGCQTNLSHLDDNYLVNIFKIKCNVDRQLADPYSGCLATRDILFCREENQLSPDELIRFNRNQGLIFWAVLEKQAAKTNKFIFPDLKRNYLKLIPSGTQTDPQKQLIQLVKTVRAESISKSIRSHLIFSDVLVSQRVQSDGKISVECLLGVPSLLRMGLITLEDPLMKSLTS